MSVLVQLISHQALVIGELQLEAQHLKRKVRRMESHVMDTEKDEVRGSIGIDWLIPRRIPLCRCHTIENPLRIPLCSML